MNMEPQEIIDAAAEKYNKPIDDLVATGESEIQRFYKDTTLFLTGGSGFLGKQLIEKLFRCCDIKKAYVLIRPKKGKTIQERLQEILQNRVFDKVRKQKPNFDSTIIGVEGDVAELNLGLKQEDWNTISEEVNIIFNLAATVKFDEKLKTATLVNIRGTREAIKLAKDCKNIKSFVHVSTAYSHATTERIGGEVLDQFYRTPIPPYTMITLAETTDTERLDFITDRLIKNWPNTYTFTKAIAEDLIRTEAKDLNVAVVRPSIVFCTHSEPEPGWIDPSCVYGPTGILLGCTLGVIRVIRVHNTSKLSIVPVDFVNNVTIAAGWDCLRNKTMEPTIYHVSSTNCGVTFRHMSQPMRQKQVRTMLTPKAIWYPYLIETQNKFSYKILAWLLHYIPAYTVDGIMALFNIKKPKGFKSFIQVYSKVEILSKIYEYYLMNEWNFDETNLNNLSKRMNETDRQIYNFDIGKIDWSYYSLMWFLSVKKDILNDEFKISKIALKRQMYFKYANATVIFMYLFSFVTLIMFFYGLIF